MGALRDRMIEEMKLRNFSAATQKTYVYAITRLAKYYGKAPDQLSKEEIRMRPFFPAITDRSALAFRLKPKHSVQSQG